MRHYPCLGFCVWLSENLLQPVRALPRSKKWRVISMEFLHSFLRCHFAGKPVASRNVGCSLRLPKKGVLKVLDNVFFQTSVQGALLSSLTDKVVKFCVNYQESEQMYVTKSLTTEVAALLAVRFGIQVRTAISLHGPVATVPVWISTAAWAGTGAWA